MRYLINAVHWLSLQAWQRTTPIFYTATDTVTDLANYTACGQQTAGCYAPFLGPVWCTQSIVLTVKGGSALTRWYFNCVSCFFGKKHAEFKWKYAISGFSVSSGSAEAIVRWGRKIKYISTDYFPGNIFAKNCCNRAVYVKIIASERWDVFWDTVYMPTAQLMKVRTEVDRSELIYSQ